MPKCKNDSQKSYKGNEPSPKGLGWCAHAEKENKIRKGKDGNKWIVKKVSNGSKRWMKHNSNKKVSTTKSKKTTDLEEFNKMLKKKYIDYGKDMKKFYKLLDEVVKIDKKVYDRVNERILKNKKQGLGNFIISSKKVVISDPAYDFPKNDKKSFCLGYTHTVEPGEWCGYYHSWITKERPNIVIITNKKYSFPSKSLKYKKGKGGLPVDTGQMSVVDVEKYPVEEKHKDKWCKIVSDITIKKQAGKIDGGYVTSTGWGDGFYNYNIGTKNGKVVQFIIFFM